MTLSARAALVAKSAARRRVVRSNKPPAAPDALVAKFTALFDRAMRKRLMQFAREAMRIAGVREDAAVTPLMRKLGPLMVKLAEAMASDFDGISASMLTETNEFNKAQIEDLWKRVVRIPYTDSPRMAQVFAKHKQANVALIKTMSKSAVQRVAKTLEENEGMPAEAIAKKLQEDVNVSASKARFLARDQILKANGDLTMERHKDAGITRYEWVTSGDERVRPGHRDLDGKEFEWDKPPLVNPGQKKARHEHPGGDFQCRCTADPIIDLDNIKKR